MKRNLAHMVALLAISLFMTVMLGGQKAGAADINFLDYNAVGKVGDSWTYSYISPPSPAETPDFTIYLTEVTSGPFSGKYRLGDFQYPGGGTDFRIFDWNASEIIVYESEGTVFIPPGIIPAMLPLDTMFVNPLPIPDNNWYLHKLPSSLTVAAGTFDDVLLDIALDTRYDPNGANAYFGLDPVAVPYGVTHVEWYAAGVGEIQNVDIDAATGNVVYAYQLKATTVPVPGAVWLIGPGLLGLAGWRKFKKS